MKSLIAVVGSYLWRNRHELRGRLAKGGSPVAPLAREILGRLGGRRGAQPPEGGGKPETIEAEFRKIG